MRTAISMLLLAATLGLATAALAEPVVATEDAVARRWIDNPDVDAGGVVTGDRLDVVYREGGWVRVRLPGPGAGFGWLPDTAVEEPASDDGLDLGLPGGFDLPGRAPDLGLPGAFPGGTSIPGGASIPPINLEIE